MKLIFASSNKNKFIEVEKIIPKNIKLGNLIELNFFDEIPEDQDTIEGNASFKAKFYYTTLYSPKFMVTKWHHGDIKAAA